MENSYHVGVQEDAFILFLGNGKDSSRMSEVEQNATAMEVIAATYTIERLHVTSLRSRLRRKSENSRHFGAQRDRSFYGDLHEMSDILIMLLICVESDKIPLLHKLKQLYKRLPVGVLIDIAYTANNILYKLYTKMAVYF